MRELVARGHAVTAMADPMSGTSTYRALGCTFTPELRVGELLSEALPSVRDRDWKRERFRRSAVAVFEDVHDELNVHQYDAVMCDPLEIGADFAAEAAAVPAFSYVHWGMDEGGADVPFRFHLWDGVEPAEVAFVRWWNGLRTEVGLRPEARPVEEHCWYRTSALLTLVLGLPDLVHPKCELPSYAVRVGPTVWDPPHEDPLPEWVATLGAKRPAVLASVSTISNSDDDLVRAVANAARGEGVDVVATVPAGRETTHVPNGVKLAPFIPHGELMGRVRVVACHAGYGTVTRAACSGVPLLLMPGGRDQFQVARGACHAGVAISIESDEDRTEAVSKALHELLSDVDYRERAAAVSISARAYDAASTSADRIEELLG